ncbi:hypothetical protein LEMLEM_LOCUS3443 [Lemmus lemmus]
MSLLRQRIKDSPNAFDAYSSTFETCTAWEPQQSRAARGWREILARNNPSLKWATEEPENSPKRRLQEAVFGNRHYKMAPKPCRVRVRSLPDQACTVAML